MIKVVSIAREYGYIKIPNDSLIEETMLRNYRSSEICILCTGSQGEATAALNRIVAGDNRNVSIMPGDTVVFSSNPIPGNGALVDALVNKLVKLGADVKQNSLAFSLHSSGHPSKQELRLLLSLVHPKHFMPVHGEYRMLKLHAELAETLGVQKENIFVCDNGDTLLLRNHAVSYGGHVPAADVYIDGNDLDGLSSAVMNDRAILKSDGMVVVLLTIDSKRNKLLVEPMIHTRGFAADESLHVVRHARMAAEDAIKELMMRKVTFSDIKATIKGAVSKYISRKTGRSPMIIPVIMNAD